MTNNDDNRLKDENVQFLKSSQIVILKLEYC